MSSNRDANSATQQDQVFCVLPWLHLATSVDGVWGRCCFDATNDYDYYYEQEQEPDMLLAPDALGCLPHSRYADANPDRSFGITEAFNSPSMRRTRLQMLKGERPDACRHCYTLEDLGSQSHRQAMNEYFAGREDTDELVARTDADGHLDSFPRFLDLRLGNTCNLACIMCAFPISSKLGAGRTPQWTTAHIDPYRDDEEFWETIAGNADSIRYIYFAGGEPLLAPTHFSILDLFIRAGVAEQIQLHYNTNLTVLPTGLFDRLRHFSHVVIAASCDGTGETFESIRVGGRWETFVRNLREAREHLEVWIDVTVQRDNIGDLHNLVEFAVTEGVPIRLENYVQFPEDLSIRSLPVDEKRQRSEQLTAWAEAYETTGRTEVARQLSRIVTFMNS